MSVDLANKSRMDSADSSEEAIIFGGTAAMQEIRVKVEGAIRVNSPVLISGEDGTGKNAFARFLHTQSSRRDASFVKLNCAAVPADLLEGELLGYETSGRAALNGPRRGLVEIAEGGTLFLDEIGEVDWTSQAKLLRLILEGRYTRGGGYEDLTANVRVICAVRIDPDGATENPGLQGSILFRIGFLRLHLPPLRERKQDIPRLCEYFIRRFSKKFGKPAPQLTATTLNLLAQWNWPGNLRELENAMARIVILSSEVELKAELKSKVLSVAFRRGVYPTLDHRRPY